MKTKLVLGTLLNAVSSLAPQFVGMVMLGSAEFGGFSAIFLAYALAIALTMAVLTDAWVIGAEPVRRDGWGLYSSILLGLSLLLSTVGALVAWLTLGGAVTVVLSLIAVFVSTYRFGTRFYLMHLRKFRRANVMDAVSLVVLFAVFGALRAAEVGGADALIAAWGASSLAASLSWHPPRVQFVTAVRWVRDQRKLIRPLLIDTAVMESSAVGTPFILLPVLGLSGFGIYRSVSNLSAPLRRIIAPLRPLLISAPRRAMSQTFTIAILALSALAALGSVFGLWLLGRSSVTIGVLSELVPHMVPVALYLGSSLIVVYYSLMCRSFQNEKLLLSGRFIYTVVTLCGPLLGFAVGGVGGAIWGFGLASLLSGVVWFVLARIAWRQGTATTH